MRLAFLKICRLIRLILNLLKGNCMKKLFVVLSLFISTLAMARDAVRDCVDKSSRAVEAFNKSITGELVPVIQKRSFKVIYNTDDGRMELFRGNFVLENNSAYDVEAHTDVCLIFSIESVEMM